MNRKKPYFNSLMVRLKESKSYDYHYFKLFQFLDGAIKSNENKDLIIGILTFQFLDGAIKSIECTQRGLTTVISIP